MAATLFAASVSVAVLASPAQAAAPDAPTNVRAVAGAGQATVTWDAPSSVGDSAITDYVIDYCTGGSCTTFSDSVSTSRSLNVTGLTNATAYTFRVAAVNDSGTGPYSSASSSVTPKTTLTFELAANDGGSVTGYGWRLNNDGTVTTGSGLGVWLGPLASRSQAKAWTSYTASGSAYTVVGTDSRTNERYEYVTDVTGYTGTAAKESIERGFSSFSFRREVNKSYGGRTGVYYLQSSGNCNSNSGAFCAVFGPDLWSEPFAATSGQALSFDYAASASDNYEVYAFLVKVDMLASGSYGYGGGKAGVSGDSAAPLSSHKLFLHRRGKTVNWSQAAGSVTETGVYRFRFVDGAYDATGGLALGTDFFIDPASVRVATAQSITFAQPNARLLADGSFTLSGSASSGLPLAYTASGTCTVSGAVVSLSSAGNCTITARQSGGDSGGTTYAAASEVIRTFQILAGVVAPSNTSVPFIAGTASVGNTLTADDGTWNTGGGSSITTTYQWQSCAASCATLDNFSAISGATASTYVVSADEVGKQIRVVVTKTNERSQSGTAASTGTSAVPDTRLSGLTLSTGTLSPAFSGGTLSYSATVTTATSSVTVTPTASSGSATITVNGSSVTSGSASSPISLTVGTNTITVAVTVSSVTATTTITVTRTSDSTAPTVTLTSATIRATGSATVQSTETGTAYLVSTSVTVSNKTSITSAADSAWNSVTISAADTPTSLSASGLADGTYRAYAVDAADNLSVASATTVTVDSTAPTVTLTRSGATSASVALTFTLTGDEELECSTLSLVRGTDFTWTNISAIAIVQTTATTCTITATSTATPGGGSVTSTLTAAGSFSVTDVAGNEATAVTGSPLSIVVTIVAASGGGGAAPAAATTTTTTQPRATTSTTTVPRTTLPARRTTTTTAPRRTTTTLAARSVTTTTVSSRLATTTTIRRPSSITTTTVSSRFATTTTSRPVSVTTIARPTIITTTSVPRITVPTTLPTTTTAAVVATSAPTTLPPVTTTTAPIPLATLPPPGRRDIAPEEMQRLLEQLVNNVQSLEIPVFLNMQIPLPPLNQPQVYQQNPVPVDYLLINQQVQQFSAPDGFQMNVSATDPSGNLTPVDPSGALVVQQNNFITVTGTGFRPFSDAVAWLFSTPRKLGNIRVGADGSFAARMPIGEEIGVGRHTTQVNGLTPSGEIRSVNLAVLVRDAPAVAPSPPTSFDPAMPLSVAENPASTSVSVAFFAVMAVVIFGGGVLFGLTRRRRRDDERDAPPQQRRR